MLSTTLIILIGITLWFIVGIVFLQYKTLKKTSLVLLPHVVLISLLITIWYLFQLVANSIKLSIKALWGVDIQGD